MQYLDRCDLVLLAPYCPSPWPTWLQSCTACRYKIMLRNQVVQITWRAVFLGASLPWPTWVSPCTACRFTIMLRYQVIYTTWSSMISCLCANFLASSSSSILICGCSGSFRKAKNVTVYVHQLTVQELELWINGIELKIFITH